MQRIAYLMSDFPALNETFPGNEIRALEQIGHEVRPVILNRLNVPCQPDDHVLANRATQLAALASGPRVLAWPGRSAISRAETFIRAQREASAVSLFYQGARIAKYLRREKISHVHANGGGLAAAHAIVAGRLAEITVSFRIGQMDLGQLHDPDPCLVHADFIVANSEEESSALRARHPNMQIVDILPGVDAARLKPYVTGAHNGRLLFAGSLREDRGLGDLFTALARLPVKERPHLDLVGDGPLRTSLSETAQKAGLRSVDFTWHGPKTTVWLSEHGPGHLGLVAPARAPGAGRASTRGLVVKEAMSMGLPVVTTAIAGMREIVSPESGWLVPPAAPDALMRALRSLIAQKPERRWVMARAARGRIEQGLTLRHSAEALSRKISSLNA